MAPPVPKGPELVILVGVPGAGKTSFYREHFAATHVHVSKDLMAQARDRRERQRGQVEEALGSGRSVVVDNVNATAEDRAALLAQGRAHGARVVVYVLETAVREALGRNRARDGPARVPDVAIFTAAKRLRLPGTGDGFDALYRVRAAEGRFEVSPWS